MDPEQIMQQVPRLIGAGVQAAVENASRLGLTWTMRMVTVGGGTSGTSVMATYDGDTAPVNMVNMTGQLLLAGQRAYALIIPPSGNFIIGLVSLPVIGLYALRTSTPQALPNATPALIEWDTVSSDSSGFIATLPTTAVTIPIGLDGIYSVTASANVTASGTRNFITVFTDASIFVRSSFNPGEDTTSVCGVTFLGAGTSITVDVFQNSGGAATMVGEFWLYRLGG